MRFYATAFLSCAVCFTALLFIYGTEWPLGQFALPAVFVGIYSVIVCFALWSYRKECISFQPNTVSAIEAALWNSDRKYAALGCFFTMLNITATFFTTVVLVNSGIDFVHAYYHLSATTHVFIYLLFGITLVSGWFAFKLYRDHVHNIDIAVQRSSSTSTSLTAAIHLSSGQPVELIPDCNSSYEAGETTAVILKDRQSAHLFLPTGLASLLRE